MMFEKYSLLAVSASRAWDIFEGIRFFKHLRFPQCVPSEEIVWKDSRKLQMAPKNVCN